MDGTIMASANTADVERPSNGSIESPSTVNWPYAIGFQASHEQRDMIELGIKGYIPAYAAGDIYRTGPSSYKVETEDRQIFNMSHWFDGFTINHRFKIEAQDADPRKCRVFYNSRRAVDELIEKIRKTGRMDDLSFANKRDPCESFFKKSMTIFRLPKRPTGRSTINIGVTLSADMPGVKRPERGSHSAKINTLIAKSDQSTFQRLDPETLEPLGICDMRDLNSELKGPLAGAHAKTCPITGDIFNYNLDFGKDGTYRVFQASQSTGNVDIIATFNAPAAYLHSIFLTPSTVIVCVWSSHFTKKGLSIILNRNILESMRMNTATPAKWLVIDRSQSRRGILATYTSPPCFCFHTINAFEQPSKEIPGQVDIVADLLEYEDLSVLQGFYYSELIPDRTAEDSYKMRFPKSRPFFARYCLSNVPLSDDSKPQRGPQSAVQVVRGDRDLSYELPAINPGYSTLPHRYVYGQRNGAQSAVADGLMKHDTKTGGALFWGQRGHTPGEPIFIVDPDGTAEDDGVILSVVLNGLTERSYLLCLDARTMDEIGRAEMPFQIGLGLHHLRIPASLEAKYNGGD